jgi:UDP-N-acetylglucosamine transferase subunit ALG13
MGRLIFVTVGNAKQPFKRLLDGIEALVRAGRIDGASVCIQRGHNAPRSVGVRADVPFFSPEEFQRLVDEAAVIVCHGGAGSLSHVFKTGKIPVVMPRRKAYGEHVDDQFNLVEQLAASGKIVPAFEPDQLDDAIHLVLGMKQVVRQSEEPARMVQLVAAAIKELSGE